MGGKGNNEDVKPKTAEFLLNKKVQGFGVSKLSGMEMTMEFSRTPPKIVRSIPEVKLNTSLMARSGASKNAKGTSSLEINARPSPYVGQDVLDLCMLPIEDLAKKSDAKDIIPSTRLSAIPSASQEIWPNTR